MTADRILAHIAAATTAAGDELFPRLLLHLTAALGAKHAFIAELANDGRVRCLAMHSPFDAPAIDEWPLAGSACEALVTAGTLHLSDGAGRRFPGDPPLLACAAEGFLGGALRGAKNQLLGFLCVYDEGQLALDASRRAAFEVCAARAAAELARREVERTLGESEERLRDLFDEAPIAYVHEDLESRFLRANRSAMRILGVRPEEVVGTVGRSLVPDTPDAQRRVREAFESVERGTDTSGVVLELRRKDNGEPVWIQWWSRPDPSGTYTRTMFVDITERILLEQEQARLQEQNRYLREEIKSVHNFEEIVGASAALRAVLAKVDLVSETTTSVLITGETGTGKELIARAIHSASPRRDKPLIKLNCAALPTGLVESELFGHEKGAFSGAVARRIGRFELASGGTIFLDEVGEIPLDVQVKLLRVLQERELERVGGNTPIKADVRVIAATNRDLPRAIAEGKFRQDLYYRLNVFPLYLPPLRERRDDIDLLVPYFVERFVARIGRRITRIPAAVMARLRAYSWPGNIRELENLIERAVILSTGEDLEIGAELLPETSAARELSRDLEPLPPRVPVAVGPLDEIQRAHIIDILRRTNGQIEGEQGAASLLGMNPSTLRSRIKKLNIPRGSY